MSNAAYSNQINAAFTFSQQQVKNLIEKHPGYYPMYTKNGKWKHDGEKWTHWCDGFLGGQMWFFHKHTGDKYWLENAIKYSKPLEDRQHDRAVHDLGFIFFSTYWHWLNSLRGYPKDSHGVTPSDPALAKQLDDVLIQAGTTMSLRFKEKGQYLRSFVEDASLFVDIMMNVGILFYAAHKQKSRGKQKESAELFRIANAHCQTSLRTLIRGDGSASHEAMFNLETGECLKQTTHQGFRGDSCWSRGLTWALYGFGSAYHYTGNHEYLEVAEACAKYYIKHTPEHGVPPWDYDALPVESRKQEDSSAAAIAASGLYNLSKFSASFEKRTLYREYFRKIMATLTTDKYLGREAGFEGILKHGVYHIHKKLGVDESVMWGEYFFVEALSKALIDLQE
jgi:unsaturated chondroitin disaccharide hydrolase